MRLPVPQGPREPQENSVRIVVEQGQASQPAEDIELLGVTIPKTRAIVSDELSESFELVWDTYVAYCVLNESFGIQLPDEAFEGKLLRKYLKSHFRDFIERTSFATEGYPGPLHHWGVVCLNHVVDVVSTDEPRIRSLGLALLED